MLFIVDFLVLLLLTCCEVIRSEVDTNVNYNLNIGHAINVFANYGDLCQVTRVVSMNYDDDDFEEELLPFAERNIKIFKDVTKYDAGATDTIDDMLNFILCDTFEELMDRYFWDFHIEGTNKPWKAFMGDWNINEIMRTFGIDYDPSEDNCCYVLAKLAKTHESVTLKRPSKDALLMDYLQKSIDSLNVSDAVEIRKFMTKFGTHYIDSYSTGNAIYQVFKYKRMDYNILKRFVRRSQNKKRQTDDLRFYFSSLFLKQIGDIRVASGNRTIEKWARENLRDSQYLYSRPTLLRLYYTSTIVNKLKDLLDNGALLSITLKTLDPLFKDREKATKYSEIVENDLKLWEVNT